MRTTARLAGIAVSTAVAAAAAVASPAQAAAGPADCVLFLA